MKENHDPNETMIETVGLLHRSILRLVRLLRGNRAEGTLSVARVGLLSRLHFEGATTATALAAYLRVQPQSLTRLLADLERDGLILRRRDTEDRRQSLLEITGKGVALLGDAVGEQRRTLARLIADELTPTEQELLRLAAGLLDRLVVAADSETDAADEARPHAEPGDSPL